MGRRLGNNTCVMNSDIILVPLKTGSGSGQFHKKGNIIRGNKNCYITHLKIGPKSGCLPPSNLVKEVKEEVKEEVEKVEKKKVRKIKNIKLKN